MAESRFRGAWGVLALGLVGCAGGSVQDANTGDVLTFGDSSATKGTSGGTTGPTTATSSTTKSSTTTTSDSTTGSGPSTTTSSSTTLDPTSPTTGKTSLGTGSGSTGPSCIPNPETCNGLDDDCDGVVDNGDPESGVVCPTGLPGICGAGTTECNSPNLDCVQNQMAQPSEICGNGLDDDCNGSADDGCATACVDTDLGSVIPQATTGSDLGFGNDLPASCGGGGGEDYVYAFTAPFTGLYHFNTVGSSFDTVLVVDSMCGGPELACNDDYYGAQSMIEVTIGSGQTVMVGIDGFAGATGNFVFNVTGDLSCSEGDLGTTSPQTINGTTVGQDDDIMISCAGGGGADYLVRFIAPATGMYTFDTQGAGFDTALAAVTYCGGAELICNDDYYGLQSYISLAMTAGEPVIIVVDGFAGATGAFTLNIAGP